MRQEHDSLTKRNEAGNIRKRKKILVLTQRVTTEYNYFRGFRVRVARLKTPNVKDLIHAAVKKIKELERFDGKYDVVWCVFDADISSNDKKQIAFVKQAFIEAKKEGINLAFTNRCFELWIILHFCVFAKETLSADEYIVEIERHYRKNGIANGKYDKTDDNIYDYLEDRIESALSNAERLMKNRPDDDYINEPFVTIQKLVTELLNNRK